MNEVREFSLLSMLKNIWFHRSLIGQLTKNEIAKRYKGSYLGIMWSILSPMLMLIIYTFVFSQVIQARWGEETVRTGDFAILLFCGLNIFAVFSEAIAKAPGLIVGNSNYVKKVIFPLEILPVTIVGASAVNGFLGSLILLVAIFVVKGTIHATVIFLPFVVTPIILITLGLCWFLSSLGVYIKDIENLMGFLTTGLMFLSPIFYSIDSIPSSVRFLFYLNPLTFAVEEARKVLIWGQVPDWTAMLVQYIVAIVVMYIGYYWFNKIRDGFADVI